MKARLWVGIVHGNLAAGWFLDKFSFKQLTLIVNVVIKLLGRPNGDIFSVMKQGCVCFSRVSNIFVI